MDRDFGAKTGGGGVASSTYSNVDRRERLRKLALETMDLSKDPYFMRNHLGSYDCRLCFTMHTNEGNYLAHTQGKRHQTNLAKRAFKDGADAPAPAAPTTLNSQGKAVPVKHVARYGRPGYSVTKQRDRETGQLSLLFQLEFPEIEEGFIPRHRVMSAFEQRIEAVDRSYQYLLFCGDPYEIVAFKIPNYEVEKTHEGPERTSKIFSYWDKVKKIYTVQIYFKRNAGKTEPMEDEVEHPPPPPFY
eukprot:TRINITY_DN1867_c0_g2_i2.p1 TRINITY_DN1867_c0_g2~~TRINITY_DN1867_c0_g2_i2.p1  ORF type:complete len:245 (+),score=55.44 TRINITY_DN1867_c0_g2_i2:213-947(+)